MTKISLENIKWLVIIGLVAYIILLQQCTGGIKCPDPIITSTTKTVTHIDTVLVHDTVPKYVQLKIPEPVYIYNYDTSRVDSISRYETIVEDTMLSGVIVSDINGVLINQNFTYTTKFPQYINTYRIDSVITINTIEEARNFLSIGTEVGGNKASFNISPIVSLYTKKGYTYQYRYGIIDKTHNIGLFMRLRFKR
tara:strand:- start:3151 stop:3735 length:585 start_codon:yes stop_codon:yes gene_type:complete